MLYKMPHIVETQNTQNSQTSQTSQPSKVKITKATEEQIKKAPQITIDSDTESEEDEPHYLEEVINNFTEIDFESKYRETLFNYNALKEEHQGAKEEINGLKFRLGQATADALKLNNTVINLQKENDEKKKRNNHLMRTIKNIKRKYHQEQDDNQDLIEERDDLKNELDLLKLTNENLNNELKDLKIYSNDNEENFFKVNEENKELEDTITGLQLEKEIICKQNEELSEKVKYFRQETLNQAGKRIKIEKELSDLQQRIKDGYEYDIHDIRQEHAHEKRAYKDEIENLKNKISEQNKLLDHFLDKLDGDEQKTDDIYHLKGELEETINKSHFDFPISGYGISQEKKKEWEKIHFNQAHMEAKEDAINKIKIRIKILERDNRLYKIKSIKL